MAPAVAATRGRRAGQGYTEQILRRLHRLGKRDPHESLAATGTGEIRHGADDTARDAHGLRRFCIFGASRTQDHAETGADGRNDAANAG